MDAILPLSLSIVIVQRLIELLVAKRNEKWMRSQGAFEAGASHYPIMVTMHVAFFISLLLEVSVLDKSLSPLWIVFSHFSYWHKLCESGVSLHLGNFGIRKSSYCLVQMSCEKVPIN